MRWTRPVLGVTTARTGEPNGNGGRVPVVDRDHLPTRSGGSMIFGALTRGTQIARVRAEAGTRTPTGAGAPRQSTGVVPVTVTKKKA